MLDEYTSRSTPFYPNFQSVLDDFLKPFFIRSVPPRSGAVRRINSTLRNNFLFPRSFQENQKIPFFQTLSLSLVLERKLVPSKLANRDLNESRGIDNFNTFRRGWKVSRGVGVTNRGADGGWISTSCKLGVEGGVALRPLR